MAELNKIKRALDEVRDEKEFIFALWLKAKVSTQEIKLWRMHVELQNIEWFLMIDIYRQEKTP